MNERNKKKKKNKPRHGHTENTHASITAREKARNNNTKITKTHSADNKVGRPRRRARNYNLTNRIHLVHCPVTKSERKLDLTSQTEYPSGESI